MESSELLTTNRKALTVNLDEAKLWHKDKATLGIYEGAASHVHSME